MRSVRYVLRSDGGYYDQWGLQDEGLLLEAVHDVDVLADGSVVTLFETGNSADSVRAVCDRVLEDVFDYQVADAGETTRFHVHHVPSDPFGTIIALHRAYPVITDYPIEYVEPGESTVRVTKVGRETDLHGMIREIRELADVEIEQVGTYEPRSRRIAADLTERQQTVLQVAIEHGYYDVPRKTSCESLADELDCSAGTVSQHLRRIEASVLSRVAEGEKTSTVDEVSTT